MISTHTSILYSGMYTSSYTLYASRGSKCAPSCFDLPGLLNIESYVYTRIAYFVRYTQAISMSTDGLLYGGWEIFFLYVYPV